MTGNRADALARLDVFAGEWVVVARFSGVDAPAARSTFEWALDRQFLIQRTEVPVPEAPDFTPLEFRQRFTGTFSADGNTIDGAWETAPAGGGQWEHDFGLTYRRAG